MVLLQRQDTVKAAKLRGNREAESRFLEALVKRHKHRIYAYVRARIRSHLVHEVTQECHTNFCLGAWRAIESFEAHTHAEDELEKWCVRKGMREVQSYIRSDIKGRGSHLTAYAVEDALDYQDDLLGGMLCDRFTTPVADEAISQIEVSKVLNTLLPTEREYVHLLVDGKSGNITLKCLCGANHSIIADLACATKRSISTTEKNLRRVRMKLRQAFSL